jgi:hypothetical protein
MRQKPIGKFKPPRSILAHRASQAHRDGARNSNPVGRLGSRSHRCRIIEALERRPSWCRQVLGAISEFDKAMTVAKLRGARERKRREAGKCEGRKSHAERNPELVNLVRQLRRRRPKGGQRSLREISAELAQRGIMNERGQPFSAASINSMLESRSLLARKI